MGELTRHTPKPMLEVDRRPFLETIILNLKCFGITNILISVQYLAHVVENYFGDGSRWGVTIRYIREESPAGTGGALALARPQLAEQFLMLNGGTMFDVNYFDLQRLLVQTGAEGALALRHVEDAARYGAVEISGDGRVAAFSEKTRQGAGYVNGGVYLFCREAAERVTTLPYSIEKDLLPALMADHALVARPYGGFFIDIGLPSSLATTRDKMREWSSKPLAILDRDGVVNKDAGYVSEPSAFQWVRKAPEAIKLLNDSGYRVVVATNQSGIALGYYSEERFHAFMDWISGQLSEQGAHFDAVYYCPHHPDVGEPRYRLRCACRKPEPGMLLQALQDFQAPPGRSFLIGDKTRDCEAAHRAGIKAYRFNESYDLLEFVQGILSQNTTHLMVPKNRTGG